MDYELSENKLVSRREFGLGILQLAGLLVLPSEVLVSETLEASHSHTPISRKIQELELALLQTSGFSYLLHNELRHFYLAVDEQRSRYHADIILQHDIMDDYTLNTLSDWNFEPTYGNNYPKGIAILLQLVQQYPDLVHLQAACLLRIGEAYAELGFRQEARSYYQRFLNTYTLFLPTTLAPYVDYAKMRLLMSDTD